MSLKITEDSNHLDEISLVEMGTLGENEFGNLCLKARLKVSTPIPDLTGKDKLVEFPFERLESGFSYDTRPGHRSCYVQIKTILAKNGAIKISLSVAEMLAKDPKPTFIFVLRMNDQKGFNDASLIHFDERVLTLVLKRLRLEASKSTTNLNDKMLSLPITIGQKLPIDANELRLALDAAIGKDMHVYAQRKDDLLKTLGYDNFRHKINVTFASMTQMELVDGFLGLGEMRVERFQSFERRFDILLPSKSIITDSDTLNFQTLKFTPEASDYARLTLRSKDGKRTASIGGELFRANLPGMPLEALKIVIKTDFLTFSIQPSTVSFESNEVDKFLPLEVWLETYRAWQICREGDAEIELHFTKENSTVTLGKVSARETPDEAETAWLTGAIRIVEAAIELRKLSGTSGEKFEINRLLNQGQEIVTTWHLISGYNKPNEISFAIDQHEAMVMERQPLLFVSAVLIGDEVHAYALRATVTPRSEGHSIRLKATEIEHLTIRLLGAEPISEYARFVDEMIRVTKISLICDRPLEAAGSLKAVG